jgi:UDP-N-acetyl-D-mannosaminuronic acid dehydrogenase
MPLELLAETMAKPGLVYDFWNNFESPRLELPRGIRYMALGSHRLRPVT